MEGQGDDKKSGRLTVFFAVAFCVFLTARAQTLVDDSFDGTQLNSQWIRKGTGAYTARVSDGKLSLGAQLSNNQYRAFVVRNVDGAGNKVLGEAEVFNFYDHSLEIRAEFGSLGGEAATGARIAYFLGICSDAVGEDHLFLTNADAGLFFIVERIMSGSNQVERIAVKRNVGGTLEDTVIGNIKGVPTGMRVVMDGDKWTLELAGTVFTSGALRGTSSASGKFSGIRASDFNDFYFSAGVLNVGKVSTPGTMEIDQISISVAPAADR